MAVQSSLVFGGLGVNQAENMSHLVATMSVRRFVAWPRSDWCHERSLVFRWFLTISLKEMNYLTKQKCSDNLLKIVTYFCNGYIFF